MLRIAGLTLAFLLGAQAQAAERNFSWFDGNGLLEHCNDPNPASQAMCNGFVAAMATVTTNESYASWHACIPDSVSLGQLVDVVRKHLEEHPEFRHLSGESLTAKAFAHAFPCE